MDQLDRGTRGKGAGFEGRITLREGHRYQVRMTVRQVDSTPPMTVHGVSKNLTSTGMRIRVSRKVIVGARCSVAFLQACGRIIPEVIGGTVRNSARIANAKGEFDLGIEFDRPVTIKQPGKL